jgi:hypothetical protein
MCLFPVHCGMFSVWNVLCHLFVQLMCVKRGIVFFALELLICKQEFWVLVEHILMVIDLLKPKLGAQHTLQKTQT